MFEIFAGLFAIVAAGLAFQAILRVQRLEQRIAQPERQLPAPTAPTLPAARPLEGVRLSLDISQDHKHPVFETLLREHLLAEDAEIVDSSEEADIVVSGSVVCNGYAEIYYSADLVCRSSHETICNVVQKPPHGDRPANLAIELIARLKSELEKLITRNERRRAIRELRGG